MTHPYSHWLIYGDAGSGKTTSATGWPKPQLVFQFDPLSKETPFLSRGAVSEAKEPDGTLVREVLHRTQGNLLYRIEHYLDADPQHPTAYRRFRNRLVRLEEDIAAWGIVTVVLDSITFMELMARKEAQYVLNPTSREPRQWFGASADTLEEMLMLRFGSLPLNVVAIAHIDDQKVSSHGTNVFSIAAPGRLSRRAPSAYSEVYRAYVQTTETGVREWLWQSRQDALYVASTQIQAPDPCVQDYACLWSPSP